MGAAKQKNNPLILFTALGRRGRELFEQLVRAGFNVKQVSEENLFDAFLEYSPDLVLVEFSREAKGIEDLAHRIRATEHGIAVPVYFYGEGEGPNPVEVVSLGGDLYFTVPAEDRFLLAKLEFMDAAGSSAPSDSVSESRGEEEKQGKRADTEDDPVLRALEMAEQLSDHGWRPVKKGGAGKDAMQPQREASDLRKPETANDKSDTDEMDLLDELEMNTPGPLSEPGVANGLNGGVVPSLKAMLPDEDELADVHDEFDLDLLDLDSTMPGMAGGELGELADPNAGMTGLDVPDIDLSDAGQRWAEHDTDSWTDGGSVDESDESSSKALDQTGNEFADKAEKAGYGGSTGISVHEGISQGSEEVTLDPGPVKRAHDGKIVEGGMRPDVSTEVLGEKGLHYDQNTVVGHKKREDVEHLDRFDDSVMEADKGVDRTDRGSKENVEREEGKFDQDPIEIAAGLYRASATGRLYLRGERGEIQLYMVSGRPAALYATGSKIDLVAGLQQRARISKGQLDRVRGEMERSGLEAGEALIKMGYVEAVEMPFLIMVHMETLFYEVMGWKKGEYGFEPGLMDRKPAVLKRPFAALLLEALRRKGKGEDAFKRLGGPRARLIGWKNPASFIEYGELTSGERRVVEKLSFGMDLAEAAESAGVDVFEAAVPAYGSVLLGESRKESPGEQSGEHVEEPQVFSPVTLQAHEERIASKLEDVETGDYFTILGLSRRAVPYEVKSAHKAMIRNFSSELIPEELLEKKRDDLDVIVKALNEAAAVLVHPRYGPLYRRSLEMSSGETD